MGTMKEDRVGSLPFWEMTVSSTATKTAEQAISFSSTSLDVTLHNGRCASTQPRCMPRRDQPGLASGPLKFELPDGRLAVRFGSDRLDPNSARTYLSFFLSDEGSRRSPNASRRL